MEDNNKITDEEMQHAKDPAHEAIMIEPLAVRISETEGEKTPAVGMEFASYEEIVNFYKEYAQRMGFGTKTRSSDMRNGIFSFVLSCDKNGRPRGDKRPSKKTGCKACIRGRQKEDGGYFLTTVVLDHNHVLNQSTVRCLKSDKKISQRPSKKRFSESVQKHLEIEVEKAPTVGMEFDSYEEIVIFYNTYARKMGFGTKVRSSGTKNGLFSFVLSCYKNGKSRGKKRLSKKTGCKACIRGRQKEDGRFFLSKVILDHNHSLTLSEIQYFRLYGNSVHAIAARHGGYENIGMTEKGRRNRMEKIRRLKLGDGDAKAIYQYFLHMQNKDPNFFYGMDLDDDGRLRNIFWADARSRAACKYFDDVISFDTTYLINKYDMPLAPFVGVNHHGNSVLLGCAILADETVDTYIWLFKSWLSCMSGQPPKAIITDQCESIRAAAAKVFPETRRRLCLWHIMRRFHEKFGGQDNYFSIKGTFKKAVYGSLRVSEFEDAWQKMISNFGLEDDKWLVSLYEIRDRWVPVYLNDTFWAGMYTIQHGEVKNVYFDEYVDAKTSLKQFFGQYEMALQSKYEKEAAADFNSFHNMPQIKTDWQMEVQLSKIYTIDMFNQFQHELLNVLNCHTSPIGADEGVHVFDVEESVDIGNGDIMTNVYEVVFKDPALEVRCNCRSFESSGILCCHALSALHNRGVFEIPDKYIFPRWRKDFKRLHILASSKSSSCVAAKNVTDRYDDIYKRCHQLAIKMIGTTSEHNYERAIKMIGEATEKLLVEEEDEQPSLEIARETSKVSTRQEEIGDESNNVSQISTASPFCDTQHATKESTMNLMVGEVSPMEEGEEERERTRAQLFKHKEKRQNRLFSKGIGYEDHQLNAEKRPRFDL